jgi:hypothetical protein
MWSLPAWTMPTPAITLRVNAHVIRAAEAAVADIFAQVVNGS